MTPHRLLFVSGVDFARSRLAVEAMRGLIRAEDRLDDFLFDAGDLRPAWSGRHTRQVEDRDYREFDLLLALDDEGFAELVAAAPANLRHRVQRLFDYAPWIGIDDFSDLLAVGAEATDVALDVLQLALRALIEIMSEASQDCVNSVSHGNRLKVSSAT